MVRTDVGVCANVLLQHAGLLATYSTFLTDILPSPSPSHIHIVFIGLIPSNSIMKVRQTVVMGK